jgi:hypothetical protein
MLCGVAARIRPDRVRLDCRSHGYRYRLRNRIAVYASRNRLAGERDKGKVQNDGYFRW